MKSYDMVRYGKGREVFNCCFEGWKLQKEVVKELYPKNKSDSHRTVSKFMKDPKGSKKKDKGYFIQYGYLEKNIFSSEKKIIRTKGGKKQKEHTRYYTYYRGNIKPFFDYLKDKIDLKNEIDKFELPKEGKKFLETLFGFDEVRKEVLESDNVIEGIKEVLYIYWLLEKNKYDFKRNLVHFIKALNKKEKLRWNMFLCKLKIISTLKNGKFNMTNSSYKKDKKLKSNLELIEDLKKDIKDIIELKKDLLFILMGMESMGILYFNDYMKYRRFKINLFFAIFPKRMSLETKIIMGIDKLNKPFYDKNFHKVMEEMQKEIKHRMELSENN